MFALADSGIKAPKDLEGKTLADSAFSAIPLIFNAYAPAAGIDVKKVKWITAEVSSLPSLLATGRVDGIGQFTVGEPLLADAVKPKKLVRFAYKDAGLDYYGNGIVATEEVRRDRQAFEVVRLDEVRRVELFEGLAPRPTGECVTPALESVAHRTILIELAVPR